MTKQWDKYREVIIAEYKDQNKPLHEVQRVMMQKYGFRASTRAYRSRFDRWGVHKYSRRRRMRSMSPGRRESVCDGDARQSPRQSPDMEEGSSQATTPVVTTPNELLTPGLCVAAPSAGFRRTLCLPKTDYPYTPVTPSPNSAIGHGSAFPFHQFGGGFGAFGSQNLGCYSSSSMPMYRQDLRDVMIVSPDGSGSDPGNLSSITGIPNGYGYSLGPLTG